MGSFTRFSANIRKLVDNLTHKYNSFKVWYNDLHDKYATKKSTQDAVVQQMQQPVLDFSELPAHMVHEYEGLHIGVPDNLDDIYSNLVLGNGDIDAILGGNSTPGVVDHIDDVVEDSQTGGVGVERMTDFADEFISQAYSHGRNGTGSDDIQTGGVIISSQEDAVAMMMSGNYENFGRVLRENPFLDTLVNDLMLMHSLSRIDKEKARDILSSESYDAAARDHAMKKLLITDYFIQHSLVQEKERLIDYIANADLEPVDFAMFVCLTMPDVLLEDIKYQKKNNTSLSNGLSDVIVSAKMRSLFSEDASKYAAHIYDVEALKSMLIVDLLTPDGIFSGESDPVNNALGSGSVEDSLSYSIQEFTKILKYNGTGFQPEFLYLSRACCTDDEEEIEKSLSKAEAINPVDYHVTALRKELYISQGRYREAFQMVEKEISGADSTEEKERIAAHGLDLAYRSNDPRAIALANEFAFELLPVEKIEEIIAPYSDMKD